MISMLRGLIAATLLMIGLASPAIAQERGRFVEIDALASRFVSPPHVTIWLPPGYDRSARRYPVLYMGDGRTVFAGGRGGPAGTWAIDTTLERLIAAGRVPPVIVVGIWHPGADRTRTYLPAAPADQAGLRGIFEDGVADGMLLSDAYVSFLADELKPRIDRDYRTLADPAHSLLAGSSMGGLIAFYALARRPDRFGTAACLSPHWPVLEADGDAPPAMRSKVVTMWSQWLQTSLGPPGGRRVWFDHGTAGLDRWYAPYQQAIDTRLDKAGWRAGRDYVSRVYPGAAHDEADWAARTPEVLAWLIPRR